MMELSMEELEQQRKKPSSLATDFETDIAAGQAVGCPTAAMLQRRFDA